MESIVSNNALNYNCNTDFCNVSHTASNPLSHQSLITGEIQSKLIQVYAWGWMTDRIDFHIPMMLSCWNLVYSCMRNGAAYKHLEEKQISLFIFPSEITGRSAFLLSLVSNTDIPFKLRSWNSFWSSDYGKKQLQNLVFLSQKDHH